MRRTTCVVLAVVGLQSCADHAALHGSRPGTAPRLGGRGSLVELPAVGEARSDVLGDGWPVWVVHHLDGTATVVSAVAPPHASSAETLFAGRASRSAAFRNRGRMFLLRRFASRDVAMAITGHSTSAMHSRYSYVDRATKRRRSRRQPLRILEVPPRFELGNGGFAGEGRPSKKFVT